MDSSEKMKRRWTGELCFQGAAAIGLTASVGGRAEANTRESDLIRSENEKPGTREWLLTHTQISPPTKYRCPWIEGYCSHTSIRKGEMLEIMVSTNPTSPFIIDIYRLGYYGGDGGETYHFSWSLHGTDPARSPCWSRTASRLPLGARDSSADTGGLAQWCLSRKADGRARQDAELCHLHCPR